MIKAVMFDLDDTLISERKYIESGYGYISKILSHRLSVDEQVLFKQLIKLFTESPENVFDRLLDQYEFPHTKGFVWDLVEAYRNHFPVIEFNEDVRPCLKLLKHRKIWTGIITDGYAHAQRQKLEAIHAYDYFNEIILTDELGKKYWKPHPKAFEIMKEKLKVEFDEMIYVGDNPQKDFYISQIHRIKTIRIYREGVYKTKNYLEGIKEDHSIHSLLEIDKIIEDYQHDHHL